MSGNNAALLHAASTLNSHDLTPTADIFSMRGVPTVYVRYVALPSHILAPTPHIPSPPPQIPSLSLPFSPSECDGRTVPCQPSPAVLCQ